MITGLRAQNFKSWRDTGDLRIAPLTGLFGTNSSGKSSILQTVLLLRQTRSSADPGRVLNLGGDETAAIDLGTFTDILHDHDSSAVLELSISWKPEPRLPSNPGPWCPPLAFSLAVQEVENRIQILRFSYSDRLACEVKITRRPDGTYESTSATLGSPKTPVQVSAPIDWDHRSMTEHDAFWVAFSLQNELSQVRYLGPLRYGPKRAPYLWAGSKPRDAGRAGELAVQALLASRTENRSVEVDVARSLERLGLAYSFRLEQIAPNRRDYEVRIKTSERSTEVLLTDVGFGISQVLPILVLCHFAPENSILILEQPEIHLHPAAQSELADVLMDIVAKRKVQIIFESHSEHLLRRIQRRIAEEKFSANDAALYFCEMQGGESKATPLEITEDGFIKNWPTNFFGDEMGDLSAMTEAAAKRRLVSK